uniref:Uncharacterized protein n=1 Tax=Arundo donax TaxID=35708 RepID=A0A0A9B682_ARUDO
MLLLNMLHYNFTEYNSKSMMNIFCWN